MDVDAFLSVDPNENHSHARIIANTAGLCATREAAARLPTTPSRSSRRGTSQPAGVSLSPSPARSSASRKRAAGKDNGIGSNIEYTEGGSIGNAGHHAASAMSVRSVASGKSARSGSRSRGERGTPGSLSQGISSTSGAEEDEEYLPDNASRSPDDDLLDSFSIASGDLNLAEGDVQQDFPWSRPLSSFSMAINDELGSPSRHSLASAVFPAMLTGRGGAGISPARSTASQRWMAPFTDLSFDEEDDEEYKPPKVRRHNEWETFRSGTRSDELTMDDEDDDFELNGKQYAAISATEIRELLEDAANPSFTSLDPEDLFPTEWAFLEGSSAVDDSAQLAATKSVRWQDEPAPPTDISLAPQIRHGHRRRDVTKLQPMAETSVSSSHAESLRRYIDQLLPSRGPSYAETQSWEHQVQSEPEGDLTAARTMPTVSGQKRRGRPQGIKTGMGSSNRLMRYRAAKLKNLANATAADLLIDVSAGLMPTTDASHMATKDFGQSEQVANLMHTIATHTPSVASILQSSGHGPSSMRSYFPHIPPVAFTVLPTSQADVACRAAGALTWAMGQLFQLCPGHCHLLAYGAANAAKRSAVAAALKSAASTLLMCLQQEHASSQDILRIVQPPSSMSLAVLSQLRWNADVLPLLMVSNHVGNAVPASALSGFDKSRNLTLPSDLLPWAALSSKEIEDGSQTANSIVLTLDLACLAAQLSSRSSLETVAVQMVMDGQSGMDGYALEADHTLLLQRLAAAAELAPPIRVRWASRQVSLIPASDASVASIPETVDLDDIPTIDLDSVDVVMGTSVVKHMLKLTRRPYCHVPALSFAIRLNPLRLRWQQARKQASGHLSPPLASDAVASLLLLTHPKPTGFAAAEYGQGALEEVSILSLLGGQHMDSADTSSRNSLTLPVAPGHYRYFSQSQYAKLQLLIRRHTALASNAFLHIGRRAANANFRQDSSVPSLFTSAANATKQGFPISDIRATLNIVSGAAGSNAAPEPQVVDAKATELFRCLRLLTDMAYLERAAALNLGAIGDHADRQYGRRGTGRLQAMTSVSAEPESDTDIIDLDEHDHKVGGHVRWLQLPLPPRFPALLRNPDPRCASESHVTRSTSAAVHDGIRSFGGWYMLPTTSVTQNVAERMESVFLTGLHHQLIDPIIAAVHMDLNEQRVRRWHEMPIFAPLASNVVGEEDVIDLDSPHHKPGADTFHTTDLYQAANKACMSLAKECTAALLPTWHAQPPIAADTKPDESDGNEEVDTEMIDLDEEPSASPAKRLRGAPAVPAGSLLQEHLDGLIAHGVRRYGYKWGKCRSLADAVAELSVRLMPHVRSSVISSRIRQSLLQRFKKRIQALLDTGFKPEDLAIAKLPASLAICASVRDWEHGHLLLSQDERVLLSGAIARYGESEFGFVSAALLPHFSPNVLRHAYNVLNAAK